MTAQNSTFYDAIVQNRDVKVTLHTRLHLMVLFSSFLQNLRSKTMLQMPGFDRSLRTGYARATLSVSHPVLLLRYLQSAAEQRRSVWNPQLGCLLQVSWCEGEIRREVQRRHLEHI